MDNKKSEGKGGGKAEKSSRKERRKEQNSCKKKVGKCRGCTPSKKQKTKTNKKWHKKSFMQAKSPNPHHFSNGPSLILCIINIAIF